MDTDSNINAIYWYNMYLGSERRLNILQEQYNALLSTIKRTQRMDNPFLSALNGVSGNSVIGVETVNDPQSKETNLKNEFVMFLGALITYLENPSHADALRVIEKKGIVSTLFYDRFCEFCAQYHMEQCSHVNFGKQVSKLYQTFEDIGFKKILNGRKYYVFTIGNLKKSLVSREILNMSFEIKDLRISEWLYE